MDKFRFHMLTLSHLPQSKTYGSCAFTQKNRKLAKMLTSMGNDVFFYAAEGSDIEEYCNSDNLHFIQTHTLADIGQSFGDGDNRFEILYDWHKSDYHHDLDQVEKTIATKNFYASCIENINKLKKPDDFLLATQGVFHKAIIDAVNFPNHLTVESGIGYRGSYKGWHRVFESTYMENFAYGSENPFKDMNGSHYDRVIPNFFDPDDIEYSADKQDYFLFCARLIRRKGIMEAYFTCKEIGAKLIIIGQAGKFEADGSLTSKYPGEFTLPPDGVWEYRGFKGVDERKPLMAHAQALFSPTEYLECALPNEIIPGSYKQIIDFNVGDKVIQSDGHFGNVTNIILNTYSGDMIVIKPRMLLPIQITPEHPVLTAKIIKNHKTDRVLDYIPELNWVSAKDIKHGDYLVMPKYKNEILITEINLSNYIERRIQNIFKKKLENVSIDSDLLYVFGLYLAEGSIRDKENSGITFSFNEKETDLIEKVQRVILDKFGYHLSINHHYEDHAIQISCTSFPLAVYFESQFGRGALNKKIPQWILDLPKEQLMWFLKGFIAGDGCVLFSKDTKTNILSMCTSSKVLGMQLQLAMTKFDILLPILRNKRENEKFKFKEKIVHVRDRYVLSTRRTNIFNLNGIASNSKVIYHEDENNFYVPVAKTEKISYSGDVCNLTTENNTYLISNAVVHNCFGGSHVEALLSGTPVITTGFGVYGGKETFIDGLDGFKADTLDDFVFAAKNCKKLDPAGIRKRAERFLMDNVKYEYQKLFEDLYYVYESTLDAKNPGWNKVRTEIPEWRKRIYPQLFE